MADHPPPTTPPDGPSPDGGPGPEDPSGAADSQERALVKSAQAGDHRALEPLLARYPDRLFGVCLRMLGTSPAARQTAADLTQQALLRIIRGIHTYDGSAKVSTWMIRVTMNVVLTHLRSSKLRNHASLESMRGRSSTGTGGAADSTMGGQVDARSGLSGSRARAGELSGRERVEGEERRRLVAEALADLEVEQRALLVLRDIRGLEYEQIAEVLGVPLGTVKSRIFRARAALRAELERRESGAQTRQQPEGKRGESP